MERRPAWLMPAIVGVIVTLLGVVAVFGWLVARDARTGEPAGAASSVSAPASPSVPASVTTRTLTQTRTEPIPPTAPTPRRTVAPEPEGHVVWYAQFGAFDDRDNAERMRAAHAGTVIRDGRAFGSTSTWVVVRPAASRAEAEDVCSQFADGTCVVKASGE